MNKKAVITVGRVDNHAVIVLQNPGEIPTSFRLDLAAAEFVLEQLALVRDSIRKSEPDQVPQLRVIGQ